jgi:outer membrane protein assembly factor BamB
MRKGPVGLALFLFLCGAVSDGRLAADWPRFRGPNGTGVASDKDIPIQWGEQDGVLWKIPLPGLGNSSPVVWRERLFVQSATPDGKERLLLCLGVTDGKMLWSRSVPGSQAKMHVKNTLASSTPAVDGERVYAVFWDGNHLGMVAYDLEGNLVWSRDLGAFTSQHGAGTSPMVHDDKVFLANDQDGTASLLALEARTGKTVWQVPRRAFRACYSTPFLLEQPGAPAELIVASTAGLTSYNPQNGTEHWHCNWNFAGMPLRTVGSPIYSNGRILVTSGDGGGSRHMMAVKVGGKGDVSATHIAWEHNRSCPYVPCLLTVGEYLYSVNDRGIAGCNVAKTGETVWSERLGGTMTSSPVLIDGKVYVASEEGHVYVFESAPSFRLLARNPVGEQVVATPAVADNRLFIRGASHLFCIGKTPAK